MPFRGLAQPKRLLILASILPLTGLALIVPYLLALPIYGDEVQWKLVSSRLLIDGKLVYLFPACATGFLLDPPLTAYPLRLIEAALYADASDPRSLRLPAVGIFLAILLYLGWLAWRIAGGSIPLLAALGIVVAGLSLGVLPFLEVLNRPEQSIVVLVLIACTLPVLVSTDPARSGWRPWIFAAIYAFLGCQLVAAHIKAIFFLPAIAFSAFVMIRRPLPLALSLAVISFGVVETYRFWQARTSCPESEFLTFMFRR